MMDMCILWLCNIWCKAVLISAASPLGICFLSQWEGWLFLLPDCPLITWVFFGCVTFDARQCWSLPWVLWNFFLSQWEGWLFFVPSCHQSWLWVFFGCAMFDARHHWCLPKSLMEKLCPEATLPPEAVLEKSLSQWSLDVRFFHAGTCWTVLPN